MVLKWHCFENPFLEPLFFKSEQGSMQWYNNTETDVYHNHDYVYYLQPLRC